METVFTVLLVRFALIVGALVVLALVVFAVALMLKRRGKLDQARQRAAPFAREAARLLDQRAARRPGSENRGHWASGVIRGAANRYLDGPGPR
ncbi:hypothetical protein [Pseudonocardia acaciae]|uniref:hypothetical protein n=1 Tax=Pseudonocardia acaciae TaxID=551276 RepID=UPI0005656E62|nr:hypothetical protein [Pseudonocardia acaciae]